MYFHEIEGIAPQSEVPNLLPRLAAIVGCTAYCSMHPGGFEKLLESPDHGPLLHFIERWHADCTPE